MQDSESKGASGGSAQPGWSAGLLSTPSSSGSSSSAESMWEPQLQRLPQPEASKPEALFAERPIGMLDFISQVRTLLGIPNIALSHLFISPKGFCVQKPASMVGFAHLKIPIPKMHLP